MGKQVNKMIPLRHSIKFSTSLVKPFPYLTRCLGTTQRNMVPIQAGDAIPSVDLFEGAPNNKVNLADACKDGKFIIFGVPGAFTPGCSKTHLPGYVSQAEDLKGKGYKQIFCVSVNDPFVMAAWGENHNASGNVTMLADTCGDFTKAVDLELTYLQYWELYAAKDSQLLLKMVKLSKLTLSLMELAFHAP